MLALISLFQLTLLFSSVTGSYCFKTDPMEFVRTLMLAPSCSYLPSPALLTLKPVQRGQTLGYYSGTWHERNSPNIPATYLNAVRWKKSTGGYAYLDASRVCNVSF